MVASAMERSMLAMATRSFLLLLCLTTVANPGVLQADADITGGFISIDCGLPGKTSYLDDTTKISYAPDAAFIDTGSNYNIANEYITPMLSRRYHNVRSFPDGARNCYVLGSIVPSSKYLLRATFKYGDYDGLGRPPIFDLHIGVNPWTTVNITDADTAVLVEAIVVVQVDFVQVCLINTGSGTPFISGLDLRPLKTTLYPQVNLMQGLVLLGRMNFGVSDNTSASTSDEQTGHTASLQSSSEGSVDTNNYIIRYPEDQYDRVWTFWSDPTEWRSISTTSRVNNVENDKFEAPSAVMQTAITPSNASRNIQFSWDPEPQPSDPSPGYIAIMYFSELDNLSSNQVRQFYISLNGKPWYSSAFRPEYLLSNAIFDNEPNRYSQYSITISATANSTLPPIINALEVFSVMNTTNVGTDAQDVSALSAIKAKYQVKKNWIGDPCGPKALVWDGLTCSGDVSSYPRITTLNMTSSGLTGDISPSFADLKAIRNLYLSDNSLTGSIPDVLSELSSLAVLDLSGNQLSGSIPPGLLKRIQHGSLSLRYGKNPSLCANISSCQPERSKSKLGVYIAVPLVVVLVIVLVLAFCLLRRKKRGSVSNNAVKPQNELRSNAYGHSSSLKIENRRFTYKELEMITSNFQRVIGQGGFGKVYDGFLEDGTQVAVKLRSHSSNQGDREFLAEARILTRIHHKYLVSMIGYCKDGEYMALVYEYMSEGTLQEHIAGKNLTWRQRLRIAVESAQGLEYLHKGCNPVLIHRDVKATNILLNANMEAKIADFGLSKAFNNDNDTHISTNTLVGTPGYVDPEYQATMQPTTKSDVYSFGVVLLELITGKPVILRDPEPTSIIYWARQRLAQGNIEGIVDPSMRGNHDVNGVWKAAEIALKCTAQTSVQRPTMTDVVAQLQECLELEEARGDAIDGYYTGAPSEPYSGYNAYAADGQCTDASQTSTGFEVEHNFGRVPTMATGPAAR
ncbi:unnamed protein product [Urochloa decumbens]|uniref:non-specific serine/threonine protein kinase n=1 Tax=Urochloa decumbens TaxID=240449 RepID=A0ABC8W719_9POAL